MNLSPTLLALIAACAVFLVSPSLPSPFLNLLVGTYGGTFMLLILVLYVVRQDRVLGLATFLAASALFLEYRRRKVEVVAAALSAEKPVFRVEQLEKPAADLVPGEVHPPRQDPEVEDYSFEPTDETGTNKFDGLEPGESQDEKQPLETVPPQPGEVSAFLQAKGLAALNS